MSSSGIIDSVTPAWLQDRMGAARRWSSDALALVLDGALLSKVALLWPSLPSGGPHAVVKHRLLLALLTLKTPFEEDALPAARTLMATALWDKSADAQVRNRRRTRARWPRQPLSPPHIPPPSPPHPSLQLVRATAALIMRLMPSVIPDASSVEAAGFGVDGAMGDDEEEEEAAEAADADADAAMAGPATPPLPPAMVRAIASAHGAYDSIVGKVVEDTVAAIAARSKSASSAAASNPAHHPFLPASLAAPPPQAAATSAPLLLSELPLRARLQVPSATLLSSYAHPPHVHGAHPPTSSSSSSSSTSGTTPLPTSTHFRLSATASKLVGERQSILSQAADALTQQAAAAQAAAVAAASAEAAAAGGGAEAEAEAVEAAASAAAEAEAASASTTDSALSAIAQFLRGSLPTGPRAPGMAGAAAASAAGGGGGRGLASTGMLSGTFGRSTAAATTMGGRSGVGAAASGVGGVGGGSGAGGGGGGGYKAKRERPEGIDAHDLESIRAKKRAGIDGVSGVVGALTAAAAPTSSLAETAPLSASNAAASSSSSSAGAADAAMEGGADPAAAAAAEARKKEQDRARLLALLEGAPLLSEDGRRTALAFANGTRWPPAGAGGAGAGGAGAGTAQKVLIAIKDQPPAEPGAAVTRVHLEIDYDKWSWRTIGKKVKVG
jgi:hypothetical protein